MFYGFKIFAYYLRGKDFVVQTDHAHLTYIGNNQTPIVVRWRVFMQSFTFTIQRIPGGLHEPYVSKRSTDDNFTVLEDLLDMLLFSNEDYDGIVCKVDSETLEQQDVDVKHTPEYYIKQVHGGRKFHRGAKRT